MLHIAGAWLIADRFARRVDLTVELFGEHTVQVVATLAWATIALLAAAVAVRFTAARAARAMAPARVIVRPMPTHQVVSEATSDRAHSIERLGSCLPTR